MSEEAGTLSIDDAVSALDVGADDQIDDQPQDDTPPDQEDAPADDDVPEEALDDPQDDQDPPPAVEAPHYWTAEQKARFAEIPPDLQAVIAEQEKGRDAAVSKAQQQAAEARKAVEAEAQKLAGLAETVEKAVAAAEKHHSRVVPELGMTWEEVDWPAWFAQDRATASEFRAQYDAEREELQRLEASRQQAAQTSLAEFRKAENAKLAELIPDWSDPKEGSRRAEATLAHLVERGLPQSMIPRLSAFELSVAYDAYRWQQAQAKAQAQRSAPKQQAPAKPVRPAAAAAPSPNREADKAKNRFAQTRSVDDAVALLNARG